MTTPPLRLALIVGSTRTGRFGPTVAGWFADRVRDHTAFDVDVIDLAELQLPPALPAFGADPGPQVEALAGRLARADAFAVVTPEYNHSFPAPLKDMIDRFRTPWHAKPVGFVSYGGMSGGLRAVEQLRPVFAELHAVTVRDQVSFHNVWEVFDTDGRPLNPPAAETAAKQLLDQLAWWARALHTARTAHPYAA
ncbi:NADPH-dependent FMN reductase [Streptomyces sp. NRRL F-5727]|uniref:NADPH-dependent FMN reductase n=1 Tax=Streptomyces sp. NRRL F-5727 TaxID=1463871 RepID=UPI0004C742EF|nr:NAD(P)H-dependent oxidoreductase [Streptomyces sp. NRRL F-5727]